MAALRTPRGGFPHMEAAKAAACAPLDHTGFEAIAEKGC
jgi:hypothetical protein